MLTHLYNTQESHIPYSKNAPVNYHNGVFLLMVKDGAKTNYSPRALLYDFRGGFGALNKYEYFEQPVSDQTPLSDPYFAANTPPPKNQYQTNLDKGIINNQGLLNVDNTKYWSDYNRLIYSPRSLKTLESFQYPGHHKHFSNLKFNNYKVGLEEFSNHPDELDNFRYFLEQCDHFQGLQCTVDVDSGWGGYSNLMLTDIVDEYFNNNNKINLWVYGLIDNEPSKSVIQTISRIKSIVELGKHSSLFFPISPSYNSSLLTSSFNNSSDWHTSALSAIFINGLWNSINQINSTNMGVIEDNLLRGQDRKFVNEIKITSYKASDSMVSDVDISAYYNVYGNVDNTVPEPKTESISLYGSSKNNEHSTYFARNYIKKPLQDLELPTDGVVNTYECDSMNDIVSVDSFPDILSSQDYSLEFHVSSAFKGTLKEYKKTVQNVRPHFSQLMDLMEDKYELIEDIGKLVEDYTEGYDESDDED